MGSRYFAILASSFECESQVIAEESSAVGTTSESTQMSEVPQIKIQKRMKAVRKQEQQKQWYQRKESQPAPQEYNRVEVTEFNQSNHKLQSSME